MDHLLHRYGSLLGELIDLVDADPSLAEPLTNADAYIRAEIVYAASHEGALHLDDVLMHRTRLNYEQADKGVGALEEIADLVAPVLGWDDAHPQPGDRGVRRARRGRGRRGAGARRRVRREGAPARTRPGADAGRRRCPGQGRRRDQAGITGRKRLVRSRRDLRLLAVFREVNVTTMSVRKGRLWTTQ